MRIVAILAVHNRKHTTIANLNRLATSAAAARVDLSVVVFDDGSTDGTGTALHEIPLPVTVLHGRDQFWAAGMARAEKAALAAKPDFLLWLNDDVELDVDSISRLVESAEASDVAATFVGATRSRSHDGVITYTGHRLRSRWRPMNLRPVLPSSAPLRVDTFNGNVVLVPARHAQSVGGIDGGFEHGMADFDFGLRLTGADLPIYLAPGTFGTCDRNSPSGTWRDTTLPIRKRLSLVTHRKEIPPRSLVRFVWRHSQLRMPVIVPWIYCRLTLDILLGRTTGSAGWRRDEVTP